MPSIDATTPISLPGVPPLTAEQLHILAACPLSPSQQQNHEQSRRRKKGQLTRITAAAGSGKTTTLLALALQAARLGHVRITYTTFTNAAARDGAARLQSALKQQKQTTRSPVILDARTLHSCAHRLLQQHLQQDSTTANRVVPKLWSEKKIKQFITKECQQAIDAFLQPCFREITRIITEKKQRNKNTSRQQSAMREQLELRAREQVEFFIYKSLVLFCQSQWTLAEYQKGDVFGRDFYPAIIFHGLNKTRAGKYKQNNYKGESMGFLREDYHEKRIKFYAEAAAQLWERFVEQDIRSFDIEMKRVQTLGLAVGADILLVDESQDMDACQVDFIARRQVEHGTHVFIVGDAVQSIYGFRGARPKFLLNLRGDVDCMLTESWRFGPAISAFANYVLYAKEHSSQTEYTHNGLPKHWVPYRTRAGRKDLATKVVDTPLIGQWRSMKITIIARTNVQLLLEALEVLGFVLNSTQSSDESSEEEQEAPDYNRATRVVTQVDEDEDDFETFGDEEETIRDSDKAHDDEPIAEDIPKIHINGKGESSGLKLWKKSLRLVQAVFDLYVMNKQNPQVQTRLDPHLFPEFSNQAVSWDSFCDICEEKELSKYNNVINIVKCCKMQTMKAVEKFREQVMEKNYSADEADIILTTCHTAKGMEWNNVQVCDDFLSFTTFKEKSSGPPKTSNPFLVSPPKKAKMTKPWEFGFDSWGDDVNLAYVACTRAKQLLSVPGCILQSITVLDKVHSWQSKNMDNVNTVGLSIPGCKKMLTQAEAKDFYHSLVVPLRQELGVRNDQSLQEYYLLECGDCADESVDEESPLVSGKLPVDSSLSL